MIMKTNLVNRLLRRAMPVGVCAGLSFCLSQAQEKPAEPNPDPKPSADATRPARPAPAKVPFLGLALGSLDEPLAAQLGLPKGVGVLVRAVMPDSPADKAGVLQHDVLRYFNDQLLVNEPQLQSLVRAAGIGTEVTLKLLRKGKEETLAVKLGEHEERETAGATSWRERTPGDQRGGFFGNTRPPGDSRMFNFPLNGDAFANRVRDLSERIRRLEGKPDQIQEEIERFQKEILDYHERRDSMERRVEPPRNVPQWRPGNSAASSGSARVWKDDKGGIRVEVSTDSDDDKPAGAAGSSVTATADGEGKVIVTQNNSTRMAWNDGDGSGELVIENGKKKLTVKDADGKEIFAGPVDTEEQMKSLPPKVRERVEGMQEKIKVETRTTGKPAGEL
jgi:hypothetical protein